MEPLTWVYLALLAASTAASAKSQQKTNQARAKVQAEDTRRRKEQQKQSEAAALKTQDSYFNQKQAAADREAELAQQFAPSEAPAPTTDASGTRFLSTDAPTHSTATVEATQQEMNRGRARASQRATSLAQLGAFSDAMRAAGLEAGRNAQDIGISASNLQGWTQNVLPALYAKANTAGKDWSTAADVMKLVAAVMAPAALGGGGAAAAGTEGASAGTTAADISAARFGDFATQGFQMAPSATAGVFGSTAMAPVNEAAMNAWRAYWNGLPLTGADQTALGAGFGQFPLATRGF